MKLECICTCSSFVLVRTEHTTEFTSIISLKDSRQNTVNKAFEPISLILSQPFPFLDLGEEASLTPCNHYQFSVSLNSPFQVSHETEEGRN